MLTIRVERTQSVLLPFSPTREAIVSWNTRSQEGSLDLIAHASDGRLSSRLPYVAFSESGRRSYCAHDDLIEIATDVVRGRADLIALEVRASAPLDAIAVSTPFSPVFSHPLRRARLLDVPPRSQYLVDKPDERGWCSPAALCMLAAYWGVDLTLPDAIAGVYDAAYGGAGNWAFNLALAGKLGLRGAVAHLRNLAHAAAFIQAGIPLALSFAWKNGELPGAPVERSGGHLAVLCGFDPQGDPFFNDPAQPAISTSYPYEALEHCWLAHGAVAYLIAPVDRTNELVRLTNTA